MSARSELERITGMLPAAGTLHRFLNRLTRKPQVVISPAKEERRRFEEGDLMMAEDTRVKDRARQRDREYAENEMMKKEDNDGFRGEALHERLDVKYQLMLDEFNKLPNRTPRDKAYKMGAYLKLVRAEIKDYTKIIPLLSKESADDIKDMIERLKNHTIRKYGASAVKDL